MTNKKLTPVGELRKGQTFRLTPGGLLFVKKTDRGKLSIATIRGDKSENEFDKKFNVIPISNGGRKPKNKKRWIQLVLLLFK